MDSISDDNRLPQIMDNIMKNPSAPKHYKGLHLFNTGIQELKENTLKGITFDEIEIDTCQNLTTIHENAFFGTENVTKVIHISSNLKLTFENSSIFKILSKFIDAEEISLIFNENITEIPTNAFSNGSSQMNKLKVLNFIYTFNKINSYGFSSLDNLEEVNFINNNFENIAENAFTFDHAPNKSLTLKFHPEETNSFGFNEKSLISINRPTKLILVNLGTAESGYYLEERIYLPFLLDNPKNTIKICVKTALGGDGFNFNDSRNIWLTTNDLAQRVNLSELPCDCSESDLIWPCQCHTPLDLYPQVKEIKCYSDLGDDQLPQIMDNLNNSSTAKKHFKRLDLINTAVNELKENTIKGITFDKIYIEYNKNLTTIHENAFIGTENVTKVIYIDGNPKLTFENSSIFNYLTRFVNAEEISLGNNSKFIEIPTNAFENSLKNDIENVTNTVVDISPRIHFTSQMNKLKTLRFLHSFTKINSYAFSSLKNLKTLVFRKNNIESIAENAFSFDHASNKSITLHFHSEHPNGNGLNEKSLLNINRPTRLILKKHKLPESECYLDERIYLPFLLDNPNNTIEICFPYSYICSDPRNFWLKNNKELAQRVSHCYLYVPCWRV